MIKEANGAEYLGTGVVRRVKVYKGDPNLQVTLQIDIIYPLDRKLRQPMPKRNANYRQILSFRVRYDASNLKSQIKSI